MSHDLSYLAGVDDVPMPLTLATRDIEAIANKIRRQTLGQTQLGRLPGAAGGDDLGRFVRRMIRARRERERMLGSALFADPAWDMLLDLFVVDREGKRTSISSLCMAAAVPPTTALRWISSMVDEGLLVRRSDPGDQRRIWIALSARTRERMTVMLTAWMNGTDAR